MDTLQQLKDEYSYEYQVTKKFFERYPDGKNNYAPHEKSMKMKPLVNHIAEIFGWPDFILKTDGLDFAEPYDRPNAENSNELVTSLEKNYNTSIEALKNAEEAQLKPKWALKHNGQEIISWSKYGAIRHGLNQITHHRAQLGVYYRLLGIPLPPSYGPSADEQKF